MTTDDLIHEMIAALDEHRAWGKRNEPRSREMEKDAAGRFGVALIQLIDRRIGLLVGGPQSKLPLIEPNEEYMAIVRRRMETADPPIFPGRPGDGETTEDRPRPFRKDDRVRVATAGGIREGVVANDQLPGHTVVAVILDGLSRIKYRAPEGVELIPTEPTQ